MWNFIETNEHLVEWMMLAAAAMFLVTLAVVPFLIIRLPSDYFTHSRRLRQDLDPRHPAVRVIFIVVKNVIGGLLIAVGIAMLVLPGQGLLTIVIGLTLVDFPGKYRVEQAVVRQHTVHRAIDWIRTKAGKPPLELD